jgi:hypothetical protein
MEISDQLRFPAILLWKMNVWYLLKRRLDGPKQVPTLPRVEP